MIAPLVQFIESLDLSVVSEDRRKELQELILYIKAKRQAGSQVRLNFICTHNSRRSQFSQVWAQTISSFYGVPTACYSGGVEVTNFNARAVNCLRSQGFEIASTDGENPRYTLVFDKLQKPITAFSKLFDDPENPVNGFAAVMTCSHADENCPFIAGAEARLPLRYEDPKRYDDTAEEAEMYARCSRLIATELKYVFEQLAEHNAN